MKIVKIISMILVLQIQFCWVGNIHISGDKDIPIPLSETIK